MSIFPFDRQFDAWPNEDRVEVWVSAFKQGVARFAYRAFPQISSSALAMQAAGLESASIPQLFARDLREISPTLNEDLLDLYGRSEQVLANRFAFLNHAEALDADFDWELRESPGSPALAGWRRELHAFDYAFDLALTYRISREDRYAVHLRYLIAHWIAENPPGLSTGWELRPLARRVRNWILAADLARDEWERDSAFLSVFQSSLALQSAFIERHAVSARSLESTLDSARALQLAAKFFNGPRAEELGVKGRAIIQEAAGLDSREDGPSGLSPVAALRVAEALIEVLVFHSPGEGQASLAQAARRILVALEGVLLPDGTLPLFGPSASSAAGPLTDLFALGAVLLDEAAWKNLSGGFGIMPYMLLGEEGKARFERLSPYKREPESRAVAELGLYRLSGAADSAMIINYVPSRLPGAHEDYASFELGLNGHRVVADSGAYSPEGESWDKYFQTARAHNVLLIDGLLPQPDINHFPGLIPEELKSEEGQRGLRLPVANCDCDRAGVKSQRVFFCLEGRAWVVLDFLWGEGRHRLQNLVHFYPPFEAEAREDCAVLRSRSQNVTAIPLGLSRVRIQSARGVHSDIPGFYAPDFGVKFAAVTLSFEILDSPLPWLGGYLIVPGATPDFQPGEVNPAEGTVSFELSKRKCFLRVR